MSHQPGPRHTPVTPLFLNATADAERPRVLVVDDEEEVRSAIASLLGRRGCDAVAAESGTVALERVREEYFDVLLCDVRMPGMSGLEFLSEALLLDRDLPVLMLSGLNDVATARDALERGAMDYLTKPIELDDLDRAVRTATRHRRHEIERLRAEREHSTDAPVDALELRGGPLAGRRATLADRRLRLWVVTQPDGQHVYAAIDLPRPRAEDHNLLGFYGFSSRAEAMVWSANDQQERN